MSENVYAFALTFTRPETGSTVIRTVLRVVSSEGSIEEARGVIIKEEMENETLAGFSLFHCTEAPLPNLQVKPAAETEEQREINHLQERVHDLEEDLRTYQADAEQREKEMDELAARLQAMTAEHDKLKERLSASLTVNEVLIQHIKERMKQCLCS